SYAFDFSVWEIWGALLYGGRVVVVPSHIVRAPEQFYQLICDEGVTILNQTPSAFVQLLKAQEHSGGAHRLRRVIFGGEALPVSALGRWYECEGASGTQLINMYGITETTVHVTYCELQEADTRSEGRCSPIGQGLPDLQVYILDEWLEAVPAGVAGEIYIGGAGLTRGYLRRPGLTAQRFVANPYGAAGSRLYRTGDVGRWNAQGQIEYLGRNDQQVKIRGYRIELGEIETQLLKHPQVKEAVVLVREGATLRSGQEAEPWSEGERAIGAQPDESAEKRLVAYYVASPEGAPET